MMRRPVRGDHSHTSPARLWTGVLTACALCWLCISLPASAVSDTAPSALAAHRFACSGPNSAQVPCHFSTPSGNIRCVWTPSPDSVACVLRPTGRAYRLRPSGQARRIRLTLERRGETLPTDQQLVFPHSLSCHDTFRTMTCNQDFGTGFFKLARGASRSA
jgi:hypothetical protein